MSSSSSNLSWMVVRWMGWVSRMSMIWKDSLHGGYLWLSQARGRMSMAWDDSPCTEGFP